MFSLSAKVCTARCRSDIEADDDGPGRACQRNIGFGNGTNPGVNDLDADIFVIELLERGNNRADGALYIALDDEVEVFDFALLNLAEKLFRAWCSRFLREFRL